MALPPIATAHHVIDFLDRNDPHYGELGYNWHSTVSTWSKADVQETIRAARKNTSIKSLTVVPTRLNNKEADAVASIVQCFGHIFEFQIEGFISRAEYREGRSLRNTKVVDRLLSGIVRSQSTVTRFMTVFAVGQEAMMGFAERFPSIEILQFGAVSLPCILTPEFSVACETSFPSLSHLHTVRLRVSGVLSMVRLITGCTGAPSLQSVVVEFVDHFLGKPNVPRELATMGTVHPTLSNMSLLCPEFPMSIEDFFTVEETLAPSLMHLTFVGCKLPKISVAKRWSPKLLATLASLHLDDCRFPIPEEPIFLSRSVGVKFDPVTYVCQWLPHLPRLTTLHVNGRPIIEDADPDDNRYDTGVRLWRALCTDAALKQWCDAIAAHPTLRDVTFSLGNETGNESLPSLQALLRHPAGVPGAGANSIETSSCKQWKSRMWI